MSDNEWSNLHEKLQNRILVNEHIRKERMEICKSCSQLDAYFCTKCNCFMPVKTWLPGSTCPLLHWDRQE